jgi:hypothetical protein
MHLPTLCPRRLTSVAALACAAALIPVAALAATASLAATVTDSGPRAVSAGFEPVSASFVSPARGFVLGAVGCRRLGACEARLAATTDGGGRWHAVAAPDVRLFNAAGNSLTQASRVSGVVFAGRRDGWLYGPGLWATHDGGAHWRRISLGGNVMPSLGGGVVAIAASAGTAYAVVSPDPFHGKPDQLYASPAGRNAWARVGAMTGDPFASLAVSGTAAWFGTSTHVWATADGVHWHKYAFRCPGGYALDGIAAASPSRVTFLCTDALGMFQTEKVVLRSVNGGKTEHLAGRAPAGGDTSGQIAVPPRRGSVITIAVITPGPDSLDRSADGGKTWAQIAVPSTSGGVNLGSLSYASRTAGWVVVSGPPLQGGSNQLLRTTDAGLSWHRVRF